MGTHFFNILIADIEIFSKATIKLLLIKFSKFGLIKFRYHWH